MLRRKLQLQTRAVRQRNLHVCVRMRRQHHRIAQPGFTQDGVVSLFQREIGQPVVDQIDFATVAAQTSAFQGKLAWIGNHRGNTGRFEQLPKQQEFGKQELICRRLVDNGNPPQRLIAT